MNTKQYKEFAARRREKERFCGSGLIDNKNKTIYIENIPYLFRIFKEFLRISGIYDKWYQNALAVQVRHESWSFPQLPREFNGFKILQISDLHVDSLPELSSILPPLIRSTQFDMCVFTGDFRFNIHCSKERIDGLIAPIIKAANEAEYPALGIMGNHDYLDYTMDNVAKAGLKMLINETIRVKKYNAEIVVTGLDDVHFYRTGKLFDEYEKIKDSSFKLLLEHSPECYQEAALYGYDLVLCGHTHGGQLCLPGGIPIIVNCRAPRKYAKGRWQHKRLNGYTSNGTGASGVPLRWNCPPEIVVHTLRRER